MAETQNKPINLRPLLFFNVLLVLFLLAVIVWLTAECINLDMKYHDHSVREVMIHHPWYGVVVLCFFAYWVYLMCNTALRVRRDWNKHLE